MKISPRWNRSGFWRQASLAFLLFTLVGLFDLRSLGREFVWDDQFFIAENQFLRSFTSLPRLFTTSITEGAGGQPTNFYRPLQAVTHLLDVQAFGLDPWWHHVTNILLHGLMGILFFFVLARALRHERFRYAVPAAFFAVALWIFHPLQAQAVGYLSGRGDILVGIFTATAALLWPRRPLWAAFACALAMLSKESGILAPAFVALLDWAARRPPLRARGKEALRFWPLAVPAILYVGLRLTVLNLSNTLNFYNQENVLTEHYSYRVFTYFSVLAKSLQLLFWPSDIHHERSWAVYPSAWASIVLAGMAGFATILLLARRAWPRAGLVTAGLVWFLVAGLPTSNLIALINALIYDHWFILPSLGFMLVAAWALAWLAERKSLRITAGLWVLLLTPLLMVSWQLQATWISARSLYEQILRYEPGSSKIMNNLGMIYAQEGEPARAEEMYRQSLNLHETPEGRNNLGNLLLLNGKLDEAERELRRALELEPRLYYAHTNLGRLWLARRECEKAADEFRASLTIFADPAAQMGMKVVEDCKR